MVRVSTNELKFPYLSERDIFSHLINHSLLQEECFKKSMILEKISKVIDKTFSKFTNVALIVYSIIDREVIINKTCLDIIFYMKINIVDALIDLARIKCFNLNRSRKTRLLNGPETCKRLPVNF
jgi:hypothetical protein